MTLFWIIAAAMIAAALALLAPTLLRREAISEDAGERFNVEIAREHLADLVKQRDAGELSDEEFQQRRTDIELALAEDLQGTAQAAPAPQAGGRWALLFATLLIPAITVPVYLHIGSPQLIDAADSTLPTAAHAGSAEMPPLDQLVDRLRERMEVNPADPQGWFLLGRTYMRLDNYPEAVYAFEKVTELLPEEPAGLLSLADALAMRDGGKVGERATGLLQRALVIDPNSVTALWLLGSAAADAGDNTAAVEYWQRAFPLLDGEPAMQTELGRMIQAAGGTAPATAAALPPIMQPAPVAAEPAPSAPEADRGAAIAVEVALAPELFDKTAPGDTLFVLARAENGPPMPLAVARHQVGELPLSVTLTDAMAMMPAMKLSAFPRVRVTARVSKSGRAGTQPGDLTSADVTVDTSAPGQPVQLLIDQVVE